jgi:SAM-dependent methyltransferase
MMFEKFNYDEHAKSCDPEDFWLQVNRQMYGEPVGDDQIALIVGAISAGLDVQGHDFILDIGCGNGALSDRIFSTCAGGHGVDSSEFLIDVAQTHFGRRAGVQYSFANAVDFVASSVETERARYTKVLWYGAMMHFPDADVLAILNDLRQRFTGVTCCFIGNILDRARLHDFYQGAAYVPGIEDSHETALGLWRSECDVIALADRSGWVASIRRMPPEFYGSIYRFDAILTLAKPRQDTALGRIRDGDEGRS